MTSARLPTAPVDAITSPGFAVRCALEMLLSRAARFLTVTPFALRLAE